MSRIPIFNKEKCTQCGAPNAQIHLDAFGMQVHFCKVACLKAWLDVPDQVMDALKGEENTPSVATMSAIGAALGAVALPALLNVMKKKAKL